MNDFFDVSLAIDGIKCEVIKRGLTKRGYEVHFVNSYKEKSASPDTQINLDNEVWHEFEIRTLHPRDEKVITVHLAYPVKGAEISFDYEKTDIENVTRFHFLTSGPHSPKIDTGIMPKWGATKEKKLTVRVTNDHWLFPDSGVVFVWDECPAVTLSNENENKPTC